MLRALHVVSEPYSYKESWLLIVQFDVLSQVAKSLLLSGATSTLRIFQQLEGILNVITHIKGRAER